MSLIKQLLLAVIAATCFAFSGSIIVSLITAQEYLEEQLAIKNSDNAASLALSISQLPKDHVTIELQVSALFDSGQYSLVKVIDPDGKPIIEKRSELKTSETPNWFIQLFPIKSKPGIAHITNGWSQFGSIEIISQSSYAYNELWKGCLKLIGWFIAGAIFATYASILFLRQITAPLNEVVKQAVLISEKQFSKVKEPKIPELAILSRAMNSMVDKIKIFFDDEARRLEELRDEATLDPLTKIPNRSHFFKQLNSLLSNESESKSIYIYLIRINNLEEINSCHGRKKVDQLIFLICETIKKTGTDLHGIIGRLNGADFAFCVPDNSPLAEIAGEIKNSIEKSIHTTGLTITKIRITSAQHTTKESLSNTFSRLDNALLQISENLNNNVVWKHADSCLPKNLISIDSWRELILTATNGKEGKLIEYPVINKMGALVHKECPLRLAPSTATDEWLTAGVFAPIATKINLIHKIDLLTLELALQKIQETNQNIAVNISGQSILDEEFRVNSLQTLSRYSQANTSMLWIEIPENSGLIQPDHFKDYLSKIKKLSVKIGIEHFGREFSKISLIHELGVDYLKIDSSLTEDIHTDQASQTFIRGMTSICHTLGILIIGENVTKKEQIQTLFSLGFDAVTGPAVIYLSEDFNKVIG